MTVTLQTMTERLQASAPPYDDHPAASAYRQAVRDAVEDLSARAPLRKVTTLEITAGQADYTLPADFLRLVFFAAPAAEDGVVVTGEGLVPTGDASFRDETHQVAGDTLTIYPTPSFDHSRALHYAARHTWSDADNPTNDTLTDAMVGLALLKAEAIILGWQANKAAQSAWSYTDAEQRIDKQRQAEAFTRRAEAQLGAYLDGVGRLDGSAGGPAGMRSAYGSDDRAWLEGV